MAEKAPLDLKELRAAEMIVIGCIKEIRIQSEPATFGQSFGDSDWGIYVTLAVDSVAKGKLDRETIEFRCFRVRQRTSLSGYISPGGHAPIPAVSTIVRAHLDQSESGWRALLPNGITPVNANDDESAVRSRNLPDATEVQQLQSRRYTYLLPIEAWGSLLFIVVIVFIIIRRSHSRLARVA